MALTTDQVTRLAALQTAYDALISGKAVARVEFNGRLTAFGPGDVKTLKSEIDELTAAAASPSGRRRGAIGFRSR